MDSLLNGGLFAFVIVALALAVIAMRLVSAEKSSHPASISGLSGRGRRLLQQ